MMNDKAINYYLSSLIENRNGVYNCSFYFVLDMQEIISPHPLYSNHYIYTLVYFPVCPFFLLSFFCSTVALSVSVLVNFYWWIGNHQNDPRIVIYWCQSMLIIFFPTFFFFHFVVIQSSIISETYSLVSVTWCYYSARCPNLINTININVRPAVT